jgi:hypothetical protein
MLERLVLFQQRFLEGIRAGSITVAFRRWRRPSVRTGGTLLTPVGQLGISSVSPVELSRISEADARRAGHESLDALRAELGKREHGTIYRIELGPLRPDPRVALRASAALTGDEQRDVLGRLERLDARSPQGPWTLRALDLIRSQPGRRAGDLSDLIGQDRQQFKSNVRKLKSLGLTESFAIGYRLSPRGAAFMRTVRPQAVRRSP